MSKKVILDGEVAKSLRAIAERNGITDTARRFGISPPTFSRAIHLCRCHQDTIDLIVSKVDAFVAEAMAVEKVEGES